MCLCEDECYGYGDGDGSGSRGLGVRKKVNFCPSDLKFFIIIFFLTLTNKEDSNPCPCGISCVQHQTISSFRTCLIRWQRTWLYNSTDFKEIQEIPAVSKHLLLLPDDQSLTLYELESYSCHLIHWLAAIKMQIFLQIFLTLEWGNRKHRERTGDHLDRELA